jgi:AcrR family transcriptional regulator
MKVDGRRARGLRTRDAIVGAVMELVSEGDVTPTAQRIADRAGVSVRSVYQHFTDVEGLFQQAGNRLNAMVSEFVVDIDPALPLGERICRLAAQRATILEMITPYSRAARIHVAHSPSVRAARDEMVAESRDRLAKIFGTELHFLDPTGDKGVLDALDIMTTWETWGHLRDTGASVERAREVMALGLHRLLSGG